MSKGFKWAIDRARNPDVSFYADRDWSEAIEVPSENHFWERTPWGKCKNGVFVVGSGEMEFEVRIKFDPDGDFTYFASASEVNDSTLYFATKMMDSLATKVCLLQTAEKAKVDSGINFSKVFWTVGNFVFLSETDKRFAPKDKPWMATRMTVLLPLRMDVE